MLLDINLLRKNYIQIIATLVGTLTLLSDGMQYGWTAPTAVILLNTNSPIKTTTNEIEWMETILLLGVLCSMPITIYLSDKIGRKKSLLLAAVIAFFSWILIAAANRIEYILVARLAAGAVTTISFVVATIYTAEIAEPKIRGFLSSIVYVMEVLGILLVYTIVPLVPFYAAPLIGAGIVSVEIVVFSFMPDSPYYLLHKDQPEHSKRALCQLRQQTDVTEEFLTILKTVERQKQEQGSFKTLFTEKSNRKALIIVIVLNASQSLSSCGVLLMNMHSILNATGSSYIDTSMAANIFIAIMLVTATCALFLMDTFGRKKLLITSGLLSGFSLLGLAVYFTLKQYNFDTTQINWIPLVVIMIYVVGFQCGLGLVPTVMTGELFPTHLKAVGSTIGQCFYGISSIVSLQIYNLLKHSFGLYVPFYIFSFCCFCIVIFTVYYVPETKEKTLDEIQFILKGKEQYLSKRNP